MQRIPDSLCSTAGLASVCGDAFSLVDYRADAPPQPNPFLVRQPTVSFVRAGLKHLEPRGASTPLAVPAGSMVAMAAGIHVMTELTATDDHYASVVLSLSPELLRDLLGPSERCGPRVAVGLSPMPPRLNDLLGQPFGAGTADLRARELLLVAASAAPIRAVLDSEVARWGSNETDRLRSVMQEHSLSPLSLPEYAALSAMSLSTFKRRFREVFGEAPGRWLSRARLQHARWLLVSSDVSVTEICYASGFGDLSNFIRAFRRAFDVSPRAYRAAHA